EFMKKRHFIASTIAAIALLASAAPSHAEGSRLNEILDSGTLKVGTTGDWNPMSIKDPRTNSYKGFDIDLMTELAKDLGVELEFVPTDWKTLVNGVVSNKYDITGSASLSMKRARVAGYSQSYFAVETVPLVLKKNLDKYDSWASLNNSDVTVAATLGTTQEQQVKSFFPDAKHKIIEAPSRDFQEVLAGRADAHITSNVEAATLIAKFPQMAAVPVAQGRAKTPLAMLMPQADQVWINYVNHWVELKKANGFIHQTAQKWGLVGQ
ncbi:MAG: transporter substrate-binding domain-containing protein, partial [Granulosicoccaceae bacterium]